MSVATGKWVPSHAFAYGVAIVNYNPVEQHNPPGEQGLDHINQHQVPLELGDEVYVFEVFRPTQKPPNGESGVWYRGYVVSTSPQPKLPLTSSSNDLSSFSSNSVPAPLSEEPQVSVGIFPSSHVQIRNQVEDAEKRLSALAPPPTITMTSPDRHGRMEPLQEEDESDETGAEGAQSPFGAAAGFVGGANGSPTKARNRTSIGSIASFANQLSGDQQVLFQSSRMSQQFGLGAEGGDGRPAAPLPNLKCGDETSSGTLEPLVDEIACALREWASLLYTHLYRRDYTIFNSVKTHFDALHSGRRQLLAKTLSTDETEKLRREMVTRLVKGNVEQGLDVIVRHPTWGGLVDVEVEGEIERKAWVSAVRMYAMQVALAYSSPTLDGGLAPVAAPTVQTVHDGLSASPSNPRLSVPNLAGPYSPKSSSTSAMTESAPITGAKFYHVLLDVRAFVANVCGVGETAELYFSLFSKSDARYLTEEYCVILNHNGAPAREAEGRFGKTKTLFRDLSQHDIHDQIFLVCRIVKNGSLKLSGPSTGGGTVPPSTSSNSLLGSHLNAVPNSKSDTVSLDSSISHTGVDFGLGTSSGMLTTDNLGRQSYRRPFGCAVLEISQFNKISASEPGDGASIPSQEHQMPIFVPANEATFATIHEDIISSRIREIEKSPRAEHVAVNVRVLYGEATALIKEHPSLLADVVLTQRLGFPDVTFPGDIRNEVYLKLWDGDFSSGGAPRSGRGLAQLALAAGEKNIQVTAEIRMRDGALVDRVISRGSGEPNVTHYSATVFRGNSSPIWGELVKLDIPIDIMEQCHVFFTFRARGSKDKGPTSSANGPGGASQEKPFAFAYFPLFLENSAFVPDGSHSLVLYRYERNCATSQFYLQAPPTVPAGRSPILPPSIAKTLIPLKDTMSVRTFLVSTRYTQNETLLKLLRWESALLSNKEELKEVLVKLRFCSEVEVCKFLRDIFDALFGILISVQNQTGDLDDLVFQAFVTILGIVSDRRFTNFKPVLDVYVDNHFTCSTASTHIIKSLERLLRTHASSPEAGTTLRSSIKVWNYLFKFIVRSREIQRAKDVGMGVTSDHLETTFKRELRGLLSQVNTLMRASTPSSIIGTQTLAVQHFASILPDLSKCFEDQDLADIAIQFGDSIVSNKGKIGVWKLLFQNQLVHSAIFDSPAGRAALVPVIGRWTKPALGKFDENLFSSKDTVSTRDNARVAWVEGIRLAIGTIAAMLDRIHEALIDPTIKASRLLLGQEQDNIEYLLNLFPRLMDSYRELDNPANLESVERQRSQASVVSTVPVVFPSSYPFSLLARSPTYSRLEQRQQSNSSFSRPAANQLPQERPTLQSGMGEIACVFISLLLLAPRKIFVGWLEAQLEIEGKDNFARNLTQMFRVGKSILENEAYPADWLNINILAHRVIVKMVDPVSDILEREFIPGQQVSFTFNTGLWREFFGMLLRLLASPQLLIEEFSPQKRRAVWRLAGDIRGEGAKVLMRLWSAIGWPEDRAADPSSLRGRHGGYQVQFVPGLVEDVLSLCLSHHDELRTVAVNVLYSMIVSEYYLNDDFSVIEAEVIDRLDKLFMSQTKGDEISRAFFVGQLRSLFDEASIDDRLRDQVDSFLNSVNSFLDLLLAVRNLPEGDEYQEDRIISTLKLMSFIRGIGRSEIFIRYVNRLVTYHVALGHETEAGLTLKLHADLHTWDTSVFLDAIPELELPRQTEFARKEALYMRILAHLSKGKAWETALAICKELQHEYETSTFNYSRLSELLILESELYASIAKSDRHFGEFFRVAFYGTRFPLSVSGKQFVYRGNEWETLGAFTQRMLNKHPGAQLLKTSTIPSEEVYAADIQLLQITAVGCETDLQSPIFTNPEVPPAVRLYYQHNGTNTFSFTRAVDRDPNSRVRSPNDFTTLWTEKTVLICEDAFPTVLRRSEVVEIRLIDISPIENALNDVEAKKKELDNLERRYRAISQTETDRSKINTNVLSMALNGAVDSPVNQGIPMYRRAFFGSEFAAANPEKTSLVRQLQSSIDQLVMSISRCMKLHAVLAPEPMQPFHETLQQFFEKNFSEELARLPNEPYDTNFAFSTSPVSTPTSSIGNNPVRFPRANGSISISTNPSIRHSSIDLSYARRDSAATVRSSRDSVVTLTPVSLSSGENGTSSLSRKDSSASTTSSKFHIPPLAGLTSQRTPSFYAAGGRSLDVLSENQEGSFYQNGTNGSGSSQGHSNDTGSPTGAGRSIRSGSIASTSVSRKGSVLGSLKWKRKGSSSASLMTSATVSEE
ncbi:hypothetical protein T439DRAFT_342381 [Meredithblackwellia eburnea MCA 4105]